MSDKDLRATGTISGTTEAELALLVDAWPELAEAVRVGILAMVKAAKGGGR